MYIFIDFMQTYLWKFKFLFQSNQLKFIIEELEFLILENLSTNIQSVSVSCQTGTRYDQQQQEFVFELDMKNIELERSGIKLKEVEVDIHRKDLVIEGLDEKVN